MDPRRALESLPLPLARGYRRWRNAAETREAHDAAYFLFEVYLKYTAATAIAEYLRGEERDHKVNAVLKGLSRPSLGEWLRFLRECAGFLTRDGGGSPALRAVKELLERKETRWGEVLALYNELRSAHAKKPSEREGASLEQVLSEVIAYRNRVLGHGAPMAASHYESLGPRFASAFAELLDFSPFLIARRLVSFDSVQVEEGTRVECRTIEYMGLNPIRRESPLILPYGAGAPRKHALHLLGEDGSFLCLEPLLLAREEDVYILNHAQGGAEYLSYASGERHRPSGMEAAQGDLFERILGYRLDSARLSRIGDDLAEPAAHAPVIPGSSSVAGSTAEAKAGGEGERRLGEYRILREIGRGGMGAVFEAFQESLGRRVALKVLPGAFAIDPRRLERFRREARATARIHHPSIVPVYEVGEAGGTHYYSMEYIEGAPLDDILAAERRSLEAKGDRRKSSSTSDPASIARVVEQVAVLAEGLEVAHRQGLVHRDVKPSNILVEGTGPLAASPSVPLGWRAGRFVLVDFGLVHDLEAQTLTRSGEMVGTLGYMSPEQVSKGRVDARADVYSLGVTLYEILTLRTPFEGKSEHDLQRAILFEEPPPPRKASPRLHRDLETIVMKCLEKHPEKRYATAGGLAKDLRRFLRYEPIEARPQSALTRLGKRAWKHRMPLGAAGVIAILVLVSLFFGLRSREEARLRREEEYGPKVLAAVMKIEQSDLWRKAEAGETSLNVGVLSEILVDAGIDPLSEAIQSLGQAADAAPARPEAYYYRARALRLGKHVDEALEDIARIERIDPSFVPALQIKAEILEKRGEIDAGKKARDQARAAARAGWREAWLRADDALQNGLWAEADRAYGEIIALEAQGGEAYLGASFLTRLGRGRARIEAKDYLGAIDDLAAIESRFSAAREAILLKGKAYYLLGQKTAAEAHFLKLHSGAPPTDQDEIALAVIQVYNSLEPEKALQWCRKVKRDFLREYSRIWPLWNLGHWDQAVEAGRQAVSLNSTFASAYKDLGFILTKVRRYNEAVQILRKAVELRPKDPWARITLGLPLWNGGRNAEAAAVYEEARKLDPQNAIAHTYGACVHTNLGEVELAEKLHRRAKELQPLEADGFYLRAIFYNNQGRLEEAMAESDRAIAVDAMFSWPHANRGATLELQGKIPEAMEEYRAATARFPAGSGHLALGRLLAAQGKFDEALLEHAKLLELFARNWDVLSAAADILRRRETPLAPAALERIVAALDAALPQHGDFPPLLLTLALARLRLNGVQDAPRALEAIRIALAKKGANDPDLSVVLGEALLRFGQPMEALAVLEPAAREPHATAGFVGLMEECRRAILPRYLSPAMIEGALQPETEILLAEGDLWRYFKGLSEPSDGRRWTESDFDDSAWPEGKSGFGYGDDDDATVLSDMMNGYSTLYVRRKFAPPEAGRFRRLLLSLKVDDGAVVYLNGKELGRARVAPAVKRLPHDALASTNAPEPLLPVEFPLDASLLVPGENCIAIQGLNVNRDSSDFSLIPVVLGVLPRSPAGREKLLESVRTGVSGTNGPALLALFEGLILEEEGKLPEAAEKFALAARAFPRDPIPHLRLADCLRAAKKAKESEAALRAAIENGLGDDREIWYQWAAFSLADLKRSAADLLASFPKPSGAPDSGANNPSADVRWLVEALAVGKGVRINCGGEDYTTKDGRVFSRDRFYRSGYLPGELSDNPFAITLDIEKTEDDPLYQSNRIFFSDGLSPPGYLIPLPPGEYEVTLHFAEFGTKRPGFKSFGVLLEGREVLNDYEPLKAGFLTADQKTFRTRVDDGLLDIELLRGASNPFVSAIEIVRTP